MKKRILSFYDKLIMLLLGLFSFLTACDENTNNPVICMYGVPSSQFIVKGVVTDSLTNTPIKNIQVTLTKSLVVEGGTYYSADTAYTDETGKYSVVLFGNGSPFWSIPAEVKVEDIDGVNNGGVFLPKSTIIEVNQEDSTRSVTKTQNFKLKK
jgi:putative lipoprotein (rSAM/lipoprotein system)